MSQEQVLERFHRALLEEIQTQFPEYLTGPFTVAEIYQNLVPYGSHRARIGVEMNADYEDALLRLLAGEGGFLVLESEPALRDIRSELGTPNPNTGLYRDFAAVDVRLDQSRLDLSAAAIDEIAGLAAELDADQPVPMTELAPTDAGKKGVGIVPPAVDIFDRLDVRVTDKNGDGDDDGVGGDEEDARGDAPVGGLQPEFVEADAPPESPAALAGAPCPWCRAQLPERANVNFCPHCGTDLALTPCARCGEELESGWRFCAACGTEVD